MHKRLTCDVTGCGAARLRRHRLCERCYRRLPGELRVGITEAHHQRRGGDWKRLCDRAAAYLGISVAPEGAAWERTTRPPAMPVTPQRAYELQARLLGEQP